MKKLLTEYLKSIASTTMQGDAREESYYDSLKTLFTDFPLEKDRKTKVTVLPKPTEAGNPDFRVWDGDHFVVGYIEAKTPGTNLDQVETSEQLQRYLNTFPNVILTDFYEFRLYHNGKETDRATIARHFTAQKLRTTPQLEQSEQFEKLADQFFSFKLPKTFTAESLAIELAKRTRFLRDQVVAEEVKEAEQGKGKIFGFYQAFQKYLIPSLTPEQFADLYSQTITYGLFAARTRTPGEFSRRMAFENIPHSIGVLRDVFKYISLEDPSLQMEVIVDDIAAILNAADIGKILDKYYKEGKGEDPIVHFYETFLNQYDPATRESRGVYYTPEPVVKYIVNSVHHLLKTRFDLTDGLADPSVTVLDPAAGTLTFPAEAIKLAVQEYVSKYGEGGKKNFIRNQILKNYYALELMMAPYAIGHMKMSYLLESLGYRMEGEDRFQLYLTNTLEMEDIAQIEIPGISSLSEESRLAGKVKKEPILVIMGNPPYSGISSNINEWTEKLLKQDLDGAQSYYRVDDKPLGEKKVWLQDDYVKFLRFAQWKIQKAGKGIVAMITNHAYLDNPTFRGMRQSLMKTFDEIYILDLHGNSLKKETAPDGSKDENVFDIRAGVAIALFIKNKIPKTAIRRHADVFGLRNEKYQWLSSNDLSSAKYHDIEANPPFYFLFPRNTSQIEHYNQWLSINEIFPIYIAGIVTARDKFVLDPSIQELRLRIMQFRDLSLPDDFIESCYGLKDTRGWKLSEARKNLASDPNWDTYYQKILYRPFDHRVIYYTPGMVDWGRYEVMRHMLKENTAIVFTRPSKPNYEFSILITKDLIDQCTVGNKSAGAGISYLAPLYLYKNRNNMDLFSLNAPEKETNVSEDLLKKLIRAYPREPQPEITQQYIYGIVYSKIYRTTYAQFLTVDFPRIPFTANYEVFQNIAALGKRLIDLHLLKSPELNQPTVKYQGQGDDHIIERPRFAADEKRVYINKTHYFEGVEPEVWEYQIGGYQVMDKYLKDRKGRKMDDPRHYIQIATALAKTIEIQAEIDEIYPEVEKDLIEF
ncbi:MAG: type ISP restriction/modification enzyme [Anaerolineaceae bacterium]